MTRNACPQWLHPFLFPLAQLISQNLRGTDPQAHWTELECLNLFTKPPQFSQGQAALPCFVFAKALKKSPVQIAQQLSQTFGESLPQGVSKVEAVGGYLNFYADFSVVGPKILDSVHSGAFFNPLLAPNQVEKIVVEFSQPNTNKSMHIGHLRCLVLGDSVCRLLDRVGHQVVRATYPGDMGTHVAKSLWYIGEKLQFQLPSENQASWLGEVYAKADALLTQELGTPKEEQNRLQLTNIVKEIHHKSGPFFKLWELTRQWSFEYMKSVYDWLSCPFDVWYTESECDAPSIELVKQKLNEGFFKEDAGAIGIDLSSYKLGFALYLKSDGNGLYLTKDLELMRRKFSDPQVTKSVYVVDARQNFHFKQLFKTGELMGYPQAAKSVHLSYETVNTEDGTPFSSRALNGVNLTSLREDLESKVTSDYLERYRGAWSDSQIQDTAKDITIAALKYGLLKVDNNTQIHYNREEWLKLDGETGPYLQYVVARCGTILEKCGSPQVSQPLEFTMDLEKELLWSIVEFNNQILKAAQEYRPCVVATALYDLAKQFNRFYESCPIKTAEGSVKNLRLSLVYSTQSLMKHGLQLLGIPWVPKM